MSCCGSSASSAQTAMSDVLDCDSPYPQTLDTSYRSTDSAMGPADTEEHMSTTSEEGIRSDVTSLSLKEEHHELNTDDIDVENLILYVRGDPNKQVLKDCAYCQRIMMILEEKQVPYTLHFIDPRHKPDWLLEVDPSGHLPLLKHGESFVMESCTISNFIEEKYPKPTVHTDEEGMSAGGGIFGAFRRYLLNKDATRNEELLERLEDEFDAMNQYLNLSGGPFFGGSYFSSADISLLPRLYRMKVALTHFKQYQIPDSFPRVAHYLKQGTEKDSFLRSICSEQEVIDSWNRQLPLRMPRNNS